MRCCTLICSHTWTIQSKIKRYCQLHNPRPASLVRLVWITLDSQVLCLHSNFREARTTGGHHVTIRSLIAFEQMKIKHTKTSFLVLIFSRRSDQDQTGISIYLSWYLPSFLWPAQQSNIFCIRHHLWPTMLYDTLTDIAPQRECRHFGVILVIVIFLPVPSNAVLLPYPGYFSRL